MMATGDLSRSWRSTIPWTRTARDTYESLAGAGYPTHPDVAGSEDEETGGGRRDTGRFGRGDFLHGAVND